MLKNLKMMMIKIIIVNNEFFIVLMWFKQQSTQENSKTNEPIFACSQLKKLLKCKTIFNVKLWEKS